MLNTVGCILYVSYRKIHGEICADQVQKSAGKTHQIVLVRDWHILKIARDVLGYELL